MGWFTSLIGGAAAAPIEAIGNVLDKVFTSDEQRLSKQIILERLAQQPSLAQVELNKVEAAHRSVFVAGWRPAIGWVCSFALFNQFILAPYIHFFFGVQVPQINGGMLFDLVLAMLGMGALRTIEKFGGRAK